MLFIPQNIEFVIKTLQKNGYDAFIVGGCVRDMLTNTEPHDFDVTTSAPPEVTLSLFEKAIPTGIKHGTVTVIHEGEPIEVTSFRSDGEYSDHRRPENVVFVKTLKEDLSRRDFTVNAMAYNKNDGLQDYFGGISDIEKKLLRAVGDPKRRFEEDALRIMRLFRFSSVLEFQIEENTLSAALESAPSLKLISAERIFSELSKALNGKNPTALMPLIAGGGLEFLGLNRMPRLEMIPLLSRPEEKLFAFFHTGGADVLKAMEQLKASNKQKSFMRDMLTLIKLSFPHSKFEIKEMLNLTNEDIAESYLSVMHALGENTKVAFSFLEEIKKNKEPYKLADLKVKGSDLIKLGITGEKIGESLEALRQAVLHDPLLNNKTALLELVKGFN